MAMNRVQFQNGLSIPEFLKQYGKVEQYHVELNWTAVNTALRLYKTEDSGALKPGVRGKKPDSGRCLTVSQELTIQQTICDKRPEQLKMDFALWSRPAVHHSTLSWRTVSNCLFGQ